MAAKVYSNGNYFIVEIDGKPEVLEDGKGNVNVSLVESSKELFRIESPRIGSHEFALGELLTETGDPYDNESWPAFYRANSGFNPGSGSGAPVIGEFYNEVLMDDAAIRDLAGSLIVPNQPVGKLIDIRRIEFHYNPNGGFYQPMPDDFINIGNQFNLSLDFINSTNKRLVVFEPTMALRKNATSDDLTKSAATIDFAQNVQLSIFSRNQITGVSGNGLMKWKTWWNLVDFEL